MNHAAPRRVLLLTALLAPGALACAAASDTVGHVDGDVDTGGQGGGGGQGGSGQAGDDGGSPADAPKADGGPLGAWGGTFVDPTIGGDPSGQFGGPDDVFPRPQIAYPLHESMHPINLGQITVQWSQGKPTYALFRMRFENARGKYDFYVPCAAAECTYAMPEADWLSMARANADDAVGVTITGTDGKGGPQIASPPISIRFSPEPVRGGLYYWSTKLKGTYRLSFGSKKALPFITPSSATNPNMCGGCHSVSRNGKVIAFTSGYGEGALAVASTSDPSKRTVEPGMTLDSSTMALNPDGSRVLVSYDTELILRNTADGSVVRKVDSGFLGKQGHGYFPEWSPDGKNIVLVLSSNRSCTPPSYPGPKLCGDYDLGDGEIAVLPYNGGDFGPASVIVPMGADFNFYPSWSPDGKWIAFASAPVGMGTGGSGLDITKDSTYNTPNARLRLVASDGTGTVYELGNASQGRAGHTSTWPKFTPFVQAAGDVIFVAFNSEMDYGFLLKNSMFPPGPFGRRPQLWMFAIDLRKKASGDPSTAPIWLPFQDVEQQNHLPYWTEVLSCGGTAAGACGDGEVCKDGVCQKV